MLKYFLCSVVGYLLGCISTGIMLSNRVGVNLREVGSKSTGATNVSRIMGFNMGVVTFAGDFSKALIAVLLGTLIAGRNGALVAGLFAIIGHNWPVFYKFKGGKGIASSCAVLLYLFAPETIVGLIVALIVIIAFKYISLGSLSLLIVTSAITLFTRPFWPDTAFVLAMLVLGAYRHRSNIKRLRDGNENKFSIKQS
ncbi:MAG: glycerol-3-phosphate acyltransferase [Christensenellales bacterium]|jgi:glycerol-3-phosphate acyltransferase PlsY